MNELSVIGSLCCAKIFEIATGQTLQVARGKYMAKDCLEVQKYNFGDLFPAVKISYFFTCVVTALLRAWNPCVKPYVVCMIKWFNTWIAYLLWSTKMKSALKIIPELNLFILRRWVCRNPLLIICAQFLSELRDLTIPDKILQGVPGEEWQFKYHSIFLIKTITLPRISSFFALFILFLRRATAR